MQSSQTEPGGDDSEKENKGGKPGLFDDILSQVHWTPTLSFPTLLEESGGGRHAQWRIIDANASPSGQRMVEQKIVVHGTFAEPLGTYSTRNKMYCTVYGHTLFFLFFCVAQSCRISRLIVKT